MPRHIDAIPAPDASSKEMQVLCLGMSRTGTMSTKVALDKLGYRTYHCAEILQYHLPDETHVLSWREAIRAKMYGDGEPYQSSDFQKLLRNYSATTDVPCACFPEELVKAFPDAKVVFSTRDVDAWMPSMERSYYQILEWQNFKWWRVLATLDTEVMYQVQEHLKECLTCITGTHWQDKEKLKANFLGRRDYIKSLVPPEKLLEWKVQDGWEPLCKFLGKEVPNEPFPFENKGDIIANHVWDVGVLRIRAIVADRKNWPWLVSAFGAFLSVLVGIYIYPIGATLVV